MLMVLNSGATSFVVQPQKQPLFCGSSLQAMSRPNENFLTKTAHKIGDWFANLGKKKEEEETTTSLPVEVVERNEPQAGLARFFEDSILSWPLRSMSDTIEQTVGRELAKEERKAKPLLQEALKKMSLDDDVVGILGGPLHIGHIYAHSSEERSINHQKSSRIVDKFEVVGHKCNGEAIVVADDYGKGGIQSLRVNIEGIHYDIDV